MTKRSDFKKEFEREAVRLTEISGQTRKELAEYLGILTLWLSRDRNTTMNDPSHRKSEEDMAAELKRLRREKAILRQERDILKKTTVDSTHQRNIHLQ